MGVFLLVHGAGLNGRFWKHQVEALGTRHTVHAITLPGHGGGGGAGQKSVAAYAGFVHDFARARNLPPLTLVGHSMGGLIAQEYAHRWPADVAKLVLVGTGARIQIPPFVFEGFKKDLEGSLKGVRPLVFARTTPREVVEWAETEIRKTPVEVFLGDLEACNGFDGAPRLAALRQPALVVSGSSDNLTPVALGRALASGIPGAKLEVVQNAGHFMMIEQPEAVTRLLEATA
ncbi:MAG: alpha/beta hydrolase [Halobacteria archaeon]